MRQGGFVMAKFACCGLEFASEEELSRHQVKVHGTEKPVVGRCCGTEFYTDEGLKEHQRTVHAIR